MLSDVLASPFDKPVTAGIEASESGAAALPAEEKEEDEDCDMSNVDTASLPMTEAEMEPSCPSSLVRSSGLVKKHPVKTVAREIVRISWAAIRGRFMVALLCNGVCVNVTAV
jgi:hypothetical protein